jgi:hypothetical protein
LPSDVVDPGAAFPSQLLNRLLRAVTGQVTPKKHLPDDGADAKRRLPVERSVADVPLHTEKSGSSIGELPIRVVKDPC